MTIEQLAIELLGLPASQRAQLAEKLIASLEEEASSDVDVIWADEAERRLKQVEAGEAVLRPADAVMADARSRIKR